MKREKELQRLEEIIEYLDKLDTTIKYSRRKDSEIAELQHLIFKLKNRWKIIYQYPTTPMFLHPKVSRAAAERDNLEVELMDKGIELKYPN